MFRVDRLLEILFILTVSLSGLLLGIGQRDLTPFFTGAGGALAAYFLVDRLRWFGLSQWAANTIAIIITLFTVTSFFFTGDSVRQLMGVGKLLVYLQTILLFQQKTPRVYWQVLVLSLLQLVVGAVFNLGYQGGVLFIIYMLVAGATMMVLHLYQDSRSVSDRNQTTRERLGESGAGPQQLQPITVFDQTCRDRRILQRFFRAYSVMGISSLGFAMVLFYFLPRENSSWSGPREADMTPTGSSKVMNLDHGDLIDLSTKLVMTVTYQDPLTEKPVRVHEPPYLRGMALSNLVVDGNRTTWRAPYDQVYGNDFVGLQPIGRRRHLIQDIVLEATEDPLLHSAWPMMRHEEMPLEIEFCRPLSAVTRERATETIQLSHFRYLSRIPILVDGSFFSATPYLARFQRTLTPDGEAGPYKWLTDLDAARYPTIVRTARDITAGSRQPQDHLVVARDMEAYLLNENRFTYTTDYRRVRRDASIDSVEDFFANHRSGHCEYFASALTLMLRSQGIPARVIVGYRGGSLNEFGNHLDVEERHAHAWVEAYIRPENCTPEMISSNQAHRQYGAWVRLDPTPATDDGAGFLAGADDALGVVKSFWRDYVLGLQSSRSANTFDRSGVHFSGLLQALDLDWWQASIGDVGRGMLDRDSPWWYLRIVLPLLLVAIVGYLVWTRQRSNRGGTSRDARRPPSYRQRLGQLVKSFSPRLGDWVSGDRNTSEQVAFYDRLIRLLGKAGFERRPTQTHKEFAIETAVALEALTGDSDAGSLTVQVTESYYQVRFGSRSLSEMQKGQLESAIGRLRAQLTDQGRPQETKDRQ